MNHPSILENSPKLNADAVQIAFKQHKPLRFEKPQNGDLDDKSVYGGFHQFKHLEYMWKAAKTSTMYQYLWKRHRNLILRLEEFQLLSAIILHLVAVSEPELGGLSMWLWEPLSFWGRAFTGIHIQEYFESQWVRPHRDLASMTIKDWLDNIAHCILKLDVDLTHMHPPSHKFSEAELKFFAGGSTQILCSRCLKASCNTPIHSDAHVELPPGSWYALNRCGHVDLHHALHGLTRSRQRFGCKSYQLVVRGEEPRS